MITKDELKEDFKGIILYFSEFYDPVTKKPKEIKHEDISPRDFARFNRVNEKLERFKLKLIAYICENKLLPYEFTEDYFKLLPEDTLYYIESLTKLEEAGKDPNENLYLNLVFFHKVKEFYNFLENEDKNKPEYDENLHEYMEDIMIFCKKYDFHLTVGFGKEKIEIA